MESTCYPGLERVFAQQSFPDKWQWEKRWFTGCKRMTCLSPGGRDANSAPGMGSYSTPGGFNQT